MTDDCLRRTLKEHWLTTIVCDHRARTDKPVCFCGWVHEPLPSVGAAVDAWVEHVTEMVRSHPSTQRITDAGAAK